MEAAVVQAAGQLAAGHPELEAVVRPMGPSWNPRTFNRICEDALESQDLELLDFCKAVQGRELRLLFDYVAEAGSD